MIGRTVPQPEVPQPRQPGWRWPREVTQSLPPRYRNKAKPGTLVTLTHGNDECDYVIETLKPDNIAKLIRVS